MKGAAEKTFKSMHAPGGEVLLGEFLFSISQFQYRVVFRLDLIKNKNMLKYAQEM